MGKQARVVVFGNSLNMAGVETSLRAARGLKVCAVNPGTAHECQCLKESNPDVIVFDLSDQSSSLDFGLLRERPGLRVIGVDTRSDELLVLTCHSARALTVSDLVDVIRASISAEK